MLLEVADAVGAREAASDHQDVHDASVVDVAKSDDGVYLVKLREIEPPSEPLEQATHEYPVVEKETVEEAKGDDEGSQEADAP